MVENGQSHEENQVSRTSGSWRSSLLPHSGSAPASLRPRLFRRTNSTTPASGVPTKSGGRCTSRGCFPSSRYRFSSTAADRTVPARRARPGALRLQAASSARTTGRSSTAPPPYDSDSSGPPHGDAPRFFPRAERREVFHDHGARGEAVDTPVFFRHRSVHESALIHDHDRLHLVALAHEEIVRIVGRRHLDRAGAEFSVDEVIGDQGYGAINKGQSESPCREPSCIGRLSDLPPRPCRRAWSRAVSWRRSRSRSRRHRGSGSGTASRRAPGVRPPRRRARYGTADTS